MADAANWLGVTRAGCADAIAMMERAGDRHHAPLFRALAECRIVLVAVFRGGEGLSRGALKRARLPVVFLILDDDEFASGPAGFPAAWTALRHARSLILHAAAGTAEHYEMAVSMAGTEGSCALVETGTRHAEAWLDAARRAIAPRRHRELAVWPHDGLHPLPLPRGAVQ